MHSEALFSNLETKALQLWEELYKIHTVLGLLITYFASVMSYNCSLSLCISVLLLVFIDDGGSLCCSKHDNKGISR